MFFAMKPESEGSKYIEEIRGIMSRDTQLRESLGTRNSRTDAISEAMKQLYSNFLLERIQERVESEEIAPDSSIMQEVMRFFEPTSVSVNRDFTTFMKGEPTNIARSEQIAEKNMLDNLERRSSQMRHWIMENCAYYTEEDQQRFLEDGVYPYGWGYEDDQVTIYIDDENRQRPENILCGAGATWFLLMWEFNTKRGFNVQALRFLDDTYELEIEFFSDPNRPKDGTYSSARQKLGDLTQQEAVIMNEMFEDFLGRKVKTT